MSLLVKETNPCFGDRLCDLCNSSKALLYCRADSAKLCFHCDREAHSTNQLFRKHLRSLLCDACNSAPSSIFCFTDNVVLCQNCDWEIHSNLRGVHDRRPIEGFSGCPSVSDLLCFVGLEDLGKKSPVSEDVDNLDLEWMDLLGWEIPSVLCLEDLIVINDDFPIPEHSIQSMTLPPLPKNRNASCGKYKEEILTQLRQMARTDPEFDGCLQDLEPTSEPPQADNSSDQQQSTISIPISSSDVGDSTFDELFDFTSFIEMNPEIIDVGVPPDVQEVVSDSPSVPKSGKTDLNTPERDSALSRYKEKKKNRRYDKLIRYEARKVRAEARTRINGRFAKIER